MIDNEEIAEELSMVMIECSEKLEATLEKVKAHCSQREYEAYREGIGHILAYMLTDIMGPLYERHPQIKPGAIR